MPIRVQDINPEILRECREQIGMSLSEVQKKVAKIVEIEGGDQHPTFRQLNTLSALYNVPRWVFISDRLPDKYRFSDAIPAFRQFASQRAEIFDDSKLRSITARVEKLRTLILELLDDSGDGPPEPFAPPEFSASAEIAAATVRSWLNLDTVDRGFDIWKRLIEQKGIFVFLTSKYPSWSKVDKDLFRALSIFHETLPVIIINPTFPK